MPKTKDKAADTEQKRMHAWLTFNKPDRPLNVFPSRREAHAGVEKWGVWKLPADAPRKTRKILLTGTGRCGTHNLSKLLQAAHIDVKHEMVGAIGTSSHHFAVDSDWYPFLPFTDLGKAHVGERQDDYVFEHVVHVVRHPLLVVPSVEAKFGPMEWEFLEDNGVFPGVMNRTGTQKKHGFRGMMVYYWSNKWIDDHFPNATRVHLEDLKDWWPQIVDWCGYPGTPQPPIPPSNQSRPLYYKPLSIEQMREVDPELLSNISSMAERYGYEMSNSYMKQVA